MKALQKTALLLVISVLAISMQAQEKTLLQTEKMAQQLELSDKQKAALDKELKAAKAEREKMQKEMKAYLEEMKRDAFVQRQKREENLKNILSAEQYEKYQAMKNEKRLHHERSKQMHFQKRDMRNPRMSIEQRSAMKRRFELLKKEKEEEKKENGGDGN